LFNSFKEMIQPPGTESDKVTWLDVKYDERCDAKVCGARWDPSERRWYAPSGTDLTDLRRWMPSAQVYLHSQFEDKDLIKGRGGR
jgi:hypothetical protein